MKVLLSRVRDFYAQQEKEKETQTRRSQIGTGDRSEKIRTYNFPQGRVTDHRINLSLHNLEGILMGELDELVENLQRASHAEKLAAASTGKEGK